MDFDLGDEQRMLLDSARAYLQREYSVPTRRRQFAAAENGLDRKQWGALGELGWLGITIAEADGGFGPDLVCAMGIAELIGEHLFASPYVQSSLEAATLLAELGNTVQRGRWLPAVASGEAIVVLAHFEPGMGHDWRDVQLALHSDNDGAILTGRKTNVAWGASADCWIVTLRDPDGALSAWLVDPLTPGIFAERYAGIDGTPMLHISFENTVLPASARLGRSATAALEKTMAVSMAATCMEAIGAMTKLQQMTLEYVKIRHQFGAPLGSFQAIQHRLVDMFAKVELCRSLGWLATSHAEAPAGQELALSGIKAQISDSCRLIREEAIQLHGGIGMTDENDTSLYFRRLLALEKHLGDQHYHFGVLAGALAANDGAGLYD